MSKHLDSPSYYPGVSIVWHFSVIPQVDQEGEMEGGGDEVVLHGWGARAERTEEDGEAEDEFEALLSKTMSESVEKTKIARATTQVCACVCVCVYVCVLYEVRLWRCMHVCLCI